MVKLYVLVWIKDKCMSRKTITITSEVKERLLEFGGGVSYDKAIALLLEDAPKFDDSSRRRRDRNPSIHLSEEVFELLQDCRMYSNETYSELLLRLLNDKQDPIYDGK